MKIFIGIFVAFVSFGFATVSHADWNGVSPGIVYEKAPSSARAVDSGEVPVPTSEWNEDTKLWLARSCVGEAGFGTDEECMGIAWTYASRYKAINGGIPFVNLIRQYSAALKTKSNTQRPWIMGLRLDAKMPKGWPVGLDWDRHAMLWNRLLDKLDAWAKGEVANPVEGADHFGGPMDHNKYNWERVMPNSSVVFRNRFYRSFSN